jgi:two-component system response regulator YesN
MIKVLIVDDEDIIRNNLNNIINWVSLGMEIAGEASDGTEAIEIIESLNPDIVITDIYMRRMDGLEFLERLREISPQIKTVILSGYEEYELAKKAIGLKVSRYLIKPVKPEELINVMCEVRDELKHEDEIRKNIASLNKQLTESMPALRDKFFNDLITGSITSMSKIDNMLKFLKIDLNGTEF